MFHLNYFSPHPNIYLYIHKLISLKNVYVLVHERVGEKIAFLKKYFFYKLFSMPPPTLFPLLTVFLCLGWFAPTSFF
uniref:Uncharacterized protein n=1 Tax=Octopus bimaculoides TaxID=37653 RepID=A0A0L8FRS7_OCTBM